MSNQPGSTEENTSILFRAAARSMDRDSGAESSLGDYFGNDQEAFARYLGITLNGAGSKLELDGQK